MAGTKNLGQVAGLFIGITPPENTSLIWYDSTPSMQCHKVYSVTLEQWVVLDDNTILAVEYSALRNRAQDPGLSVGQWFKITDKNNALALAITSTKVQYVDSIGNILIDDLSASIQYHVTHQNLLIDDVHGVFDTVNKRLVFEFSEVSAINFLGDDYVLAERKVNNVWSLFKIKFSKLLSTTSGNTITWDNGFYLNFTSRFMAMLDVTGGAVSKAAFDTEVASIRTDLTNVASNQQVIVEQTADAIAAAVTDDMIFNKRLPSGPDISTIPANIIEGDTLQMIVNKVQRWFNSLKWATGIRLSNNYAEATANFNVNNNDSVETAISKLSGHIRALQVGSDSGTDNVIVSPGYNDAPTSDNGSGVGSVLTRLLEKLRYYSIKHEDTNGIKVASNFSPEQAEEPITPGVTHLTRLLANLQYWVNQFKTTNGIKLDSSYSPHNEIITPGTTILTKILCKFGYDLNEIFSSAWRVPYFSILIYNRQPKYDNVIGSPNDVQKRIADNAGKSWFPCGYFFVGTKQQCNEERNKWDTLYGDAYINWEEKSISSDKYALRMISCFDYVIPDLSEKFLSGYNASNTNSSYGTNLIGRSGGSNSHTITIDEMPKHNHDTSNSVKDATITTTTNGKHTHSISTGAAETGVASGAQKGTNEYGAFSSREAGGHQHSFELKARGGGASFDIRPAFITVGYIIRLPSY